MIHYERQGVYISSNIEKTVEELDTFIELVTNLRAIKKLPKSFSFEITEKSGEVYINF